MLTFIIVSSSLQKFTSESDPYARPDTRSYDVPYHALASTQFVVESVDIFTCAPNIISPCATKSFVIPPTTKSRRKIILHEQKHHSNMSWLIHLRAGGRYGNACLNLKLGDHATAPGSPTMRSH